MNKLDSLILYFDPEAGAKRIKSRKLAESYKNLRGYEASNKSDRWSKWTPGNGGPNDEVRVHTLGARERARDLVRNNPWASNALQVLTSSIVGLGIIGSIKGENERNRNDVQNLWRAWAQTTACDANGQSNFIGLQRLAVRATIEGGQAFIIKKRLPSSAKAAMPLQLQVLEADFLDTEKTSVSGTGNGNRIISGVEFDKSDKVIAYWLYPSHPNDSIGSMKIESRRFPASEVAHLYRIDRPGQAIGMTWFAPVVRTFRDIDEYAEAQIVKQKISAAFAGFIHDSEKSDLPIEAEENDIVFGAGTISTLGPGKDITFSTPPSVSDYPAFMRACLSSAATGLGITYEALTGDLSNVNFSSGRLGANRMKRNVEDWQWNLFVPMLCDRVWQWFFETAAIMTGRNLDGVTVEWTTPAFQLVDPTRELPAIRNAVRSGLKSLSEALRELGYEPDKVLREIASDNKLIDELGLVLDTDARKVSAGGLTQARPDGEGGTAIPSTEVPE